MASKLFTEAPASMTLEKFRQELARVADTLEAERAAAEDAERTAREEAEKTKSGRKPQQLERFARVRVGEVLTDPRDKSESFLVSYSDEDQIASKRMDEARLPKARLEQVDRKWYEGRDPCCA